MRASMVSWLSGMCVATLCSIASGEPLPKSGSISIHTGWKDSGEAMETGEKNMQGHGSVVGSSFNDKGSGPLHGGPATCFYTFFAGEKGTVNKGYCTFGDPDGDRIFTDWHGTQAGDGGEGINQIAGGTGKYAGITGSGPWKCKDSGKNGQSSCTQRFDYRLP